MTNCNNHTVQHLRKVARFSGDMRDRACRVLEGAASNAHTLMSAGGQKVP